MNPIVKIGTEENDIFTFTLSGVNVSLANALRRTIIADIQTVVFKTIPYEENKANIIVNTSRLNNEILKQRLSCIPIHITDLNMNLKDYIMELNVENMTDTIMYVTTEDFKIKNVVLNKYLSDKDRQVIFPPNDKTGYYIDFIRLRPKVSDEIKGEKIHLTCEFSISTPKEDSMYNVVSTCAYGYTIDEVHLEEILSKKQQEWKDGGMTKEEIEFESKNWKLLEGQRVVKKDSFDYTIQTVGVYTNRELVQKACSILVDRFNELNTIIETDELEIKLSENTLKNSYDIILKNDDYTVGKSIEFALYSKFYEGLKTLSYSGYKKMHPHDSDSIIRVAYREDTDKTVLKQNLKLCIIDLIKVFKEIGDKF